MTNFAIGCRNGNFGPISWSTLVNNKGSPISIDGSIWACQLTPWKTLNSPPLVIRGIPDFMFGGYQNWLVVSNIWIIFHNIWHVILPKCVARGAPRFVTLGLPGAITLVGSACDPTGFALHHPRATLTAIRFADRAAHHNLWFLSISTFGRLCQQCA